MRILIKKSILLLLCSYSIFFNPFADFFDQGNHLDFFIRLLLISLTLSFLIDMVSESLKWSLYLLFSILCFLEPHFLYFLPLILYSLYQSIGKWSTALLIVFLFYEPYGIGILIAMIALNFSYDETSYEQLFWENIHLKDDYQETLIKEKLDKQNWESEKEKNVQIAILSERNRIAREIHDTIGHTISSSILQVEVLKLSLSDQRIFPQLNTLQHTLQSGMFDIRRSLHHLHSSSISLKEEITSLIAATPQLRMELTYQASDEQMPHELKFALISVIKECIANVHKHSDAHLIKIRFIENPDFYALTVKDNGSLNQEKHRSNPNITLGIGLLSMQQLAKRYDGYLNYGYDQGFQIHMIFKKEKKNHENYCN